MYLFLGGRVATEIILNSYAWNICLLPFICLFNHSIKLLRVKQQVGIIYVNEFQKLDQFKSKLLDKIVSVLSMLITFENLILKYICLAWHD